jgi:transposase InsO family protein
MHDRRKESAVAFLEAAVAYYASLGIKVQRVMTDNGSCYRSKTFRAACIRLGLRQIFTMPYTPRTNGKAERLIQTSLREWAYAAPITLQVNAPPSCRDGFIATIGIDLMAASAQSRPSVDSA